MPDANPVLIDMIKTVATALGPDLIGRTAFVGGVTTGLHVTDDFAREGVRLTDDVDLIVDVVSHGSWYQFESELRDRGFTVSADDEVICRRRLGELKVDFMPDDEQILGFSNRWYAAGLESAIEYEIDDETTIRLLTPPLFLATKLEAFRGRGDGDLLGSRDIEDILTLIDGRETLAAEIAEAPEDIKAYVSEQLKTLLDMDQFENAVAGNLPGTGRDTVAFRRIEEIVAIGSE